MKYDKGYWLTKDTRTFLGRGYLKEGQTAEERIREIADAAEKILKIEGFADKLEDYILRGWISLASPIWSNFGTNSGLPISCNGTYVGDTINSMLTATAEIGKMTQLGAGTSATFGAIRPRGTEISTGGTADGPVHYMELLSSVTNIISQSQIRRGHCAVWLPIEHKDIKEFLTLREEGSRIQNLSIGVTVTDDWMKSMIEGDEAKRKIWTAVIKKRFESGYPYIMFIDTVNRNKPEVYRNMPIYASNMCAEIALPSSEEESFVCCLASLNALHWDDWKTTDVPKVVLYLLDAVMEEYIQKTENLPFMSRANRFAKRHRAVGVGILGWHTYLQRNMIPFESDVAKSINLNISEYIDEMTLEGTRELAVLFGEPEVCKGSGHRNATRMAIAPTTSSSFILGAVSQSTEPNNSNYFTKDLQKGKFTYKNEFLKELLREKEKDTKEIWDSILISGGSVQHLDFLSDHEKNVFKTFGEISQYEVILQAAGRQMFIDQAQSTNLMIHPSSKPKDVNLLIIEAWKLGVKTLYYQRSTNPAQEYARSLLACESCEA